MPGPLDWWNRIRRVVGPPGAPASRAAVPTTADAARRAELAAVFAHLDELETQLRVAEQRRVEEAAVIATVAARERDRLLADARVRAEKARAVATTQRRVAVDRDAERLRADAASRVGDLRRSAAAAMPPMVADAVARVRSFAESGSDRSA